MTNFSESYGILQGAMMSLLTLDDLDEGRKEYIRHALERAKDAMLKETIKKEGKDGSQDA